MHLLVYERYEVELSFNTIEDLQKECKTYASVNNYQFKVISDGKERLRLSS